MQLNAIKREITGKASRRLRREGKLPAVVYGQRAASAIIELDNREFERVFARSGRTQLIDLVIDSGRPHKVLIKEVQLSPRRNTVLHADKVECMPTRIPELIEVDVSDLPEVDAAVRLSDLHVPEGVTVIGDPDDVVVKLAARRVIEVEEEEAAAEAAEEEAAPAAEAEEGAAASEEG